jgi:hypothetical protein
MGKMAIFANGATRVAPFFDAVLLYKFPTFRNCTLRHMGEVLSQTATHCSCCFVCGELIRTMTRSRQVYSHAVQRVSNNMAINDTPVPQTRLDRRAFEGQKS